MGAERNEAPRIALYDEAGITRQPTPIKLDFSSLGMFFPPISREMLVVEILPEGKQMHAKIESTGSINQFEFFDWAKLRGNAVVRITKCHNKLLGN